MRRRFSRHLLFVLGGMFLVSQTFASAPTQAWRKKLPAAGLTVALNPLNPNTVYAEGNGGLAISFDKGKTWPLQRSPGVSSIRQILIHPTDTMTIFCAGAGDLRKTTNYGQTWYSVLANYSIDGESMAFDPVHPDTMYAGEFAGQTYKSTNKGETWTLKGTAATGLCAFSVRPDSVNILYAGTSTGTISKSTNSGVTWRIVKHSISGVGFQEVPKISISISHPLIAYATINGSPDTSLGIWKTTNGGETWLKTNAPILPFWAVDIEQGDPNVAYAGTFLDEISAVYKTSDGGVSWIPISKGFSPRGYVWGLKVHPMDPSVVWASVTNDVFGFGGVYRLSTSTSGIEGVVLNAVTMDTVKNGFAVNTSTGDSVVLSDVSGVFRFDYYEDDPLLTPVVHLQAYPYYHKNVQISFIPDSLLGGNIFMDELAVRSITGTVKDSAAQLPRVAIVHLYATSSVGTEEYAESTDANGNFHIDNLYISYPPTLTYDKLTLVPEIPYAQTSLPVILDSSGLSLNFRLLPADLFIVGVSDSSAYNSYYQIALESLHVSFSTWDIKRQGLPPLSNADQFNKKTIIYYTGSLHTPLPSAALDSLTACLHAGCNLFLTGQDIAEQNSASSLFMNDLNVGFGGNSPVTFTSGLTGCLFDGLGFFTAQGGAGNQTSRDILTPLISRVKPVMGYGFGDLGTAAVRIDSVGTGGKAIVMGFGFEAISTAGDRKKVIQNVIGYFDGSIILDVNDNPRAGSLPKDYRLEQNYPNPFNPVTQLQFTNSKFQMVTLKIYDMLGSEVATIVNQELQPGVYTKTWDAGNSAGGVYYYRLKAGSYSEIKKMLLVK